MTSSAGEVCPKSESSIGQAMRVRFLSDSTRSNSSPWLAMARKTNWKAPTGICLRRGTGENYTFFFNTRSAPGTCSGSSAQARNSWSCTGRRFALR
jgi:hypothetical protein